jgi:hypothetical protein
MTSYETLSQGAQTDRAYRSGFMPLRGLPGLRLLY